MMRFTLFILVLATMAAGFVFFTNPAEFQRVAIASEATAHHVWSTIEAHPAPVIFAVATFLLTVVYHWAKGKSLRESVEVAATRVAVVALPQSSGDENPVVTRAKARATRTQLVADQIGLENRRRKLPHEIERAEREVCYAEQSVADLERALGEKRKACAEVIERLDALRDEHATVEAELEEIAVELEKLAELV